MRDYVKAIEALREAEIHDETKAHTKEIEDQLWKCQQAQFAQREGESDEDVMQRAMRDPEVAVRCPFLFSLHSPVLTEFFYTANYGRPGHAVDPATSSVQPCSTPGPHEKPHCPGQDQQVNQRGHNQDEMNWLIPGAVLIERICTWLAAYHLYFFSPSAVYFSMLIICFIGINPQCICLLLNSTVV